MAIHPRYRRPRRQRTPKNTVVIATEGEKTERIYFDALKERCRQVVTVIVSPGRPGQSNPARVLRRLRREYAKFTRKSGDQGWLVVDTDRWTQEERRNVVRQIADEDDLHLAASNPCFELWLLLHFRDAWEGVSSDDLARELARHLGSFSKSDYNVEALLPRVPEACERAGRSDASQPDQWPGPGQTQVHRLVRILA